MGIESYLGVPLRLIGFIRRAADFQHNSRT